jgi:hypothetical protein
LRDFKTKLSCQKGFWQQLMFYNFYKIITLKCLGKNIKLQ